MSKQRMLNVLNPPALRYFSEVAQAGSFRQAAHNLGIAASAIHRQIGLLEDQLGVRLFERSRGSTGVELTAAGEALAYRSGRALAEISQGINEIIDMNRIKRGRLTIGTTDAVATDLLAPMIGEYRRTNPRVDFQIRIGDKAELLARHNELQLDLLVMFNMPAYLGLRVLDEIKLPTFVVTSGNHPLAIANSDTVSLDECVAYPMVLATDPSIQDGILGRILAATGVRPHVVMTTNSYVFMRETVRHSDIIAIQGMFAARGVHRSDDLCCIPLRETLGRFSTLTVSAPVNREIAQLTDEFVQVLVNAAAVKEKLGRTR